MTVMKAHEKTVEATTYWKGAAGTFLLYKSSPVDRDSFIREGVPVNYVHDLADRMRMNRKNMYRILNLSRATVNRKKTEDVRLSSDNSDKVVGLAKLIGQVETIIEESGNPEGFDAAAWLAEWIARPLAALGNRMPEDFMGTSDGRELISQILARGQSGAYS